MFKVWLLLATALLCSTVLRSKMAANSGGGRGIGCTIYGRGDRESLEGEWNGRIGRLLSASYLTASLPAIYTDEPLETIAMQRSNTSSNAIAATGKQYKDTLQLTVILYHLEGNGAACVQSSVLYTRSEKYFCTKYSL